MVATFGSIQSVISRKLQDANNTAISASNVADAINDAVRFWKYERFWFNEAAATTTLVVNQAVIPGMPSDLLYELEPNGLTIQYNNLTYRIVKVAPQRYDAESVNGIGIPYIYTWRAGTYYLYYLPNIAYTLNIYYIKDYADLVNLTDTSDWTKYAEKLVTYDALSRLLGEDRQDEREGTFWSKAVREKQNLKKRSTGQAASGNLTIETII